MFIDFSNPIVQQDMIDKGIFLLILLVCVLALNYFFSKKNHTNKKA